MTPEEMGGALGAGWERRDGGWRYEHSPAYLFVLEPCELSGGHGWAVEYQQGGPRNVHVPCASPEAAIDVAHLLVAAERIAGGAEVTAAERARWVHRFRADPGFLRVHVPYDASAADARRLALDLLRAADEAEAQP